MKTTLLKFAMVTSLLLVFAMTAQGLIPNDDDGDGVPNGTDLCPAENSAPFDRNGDGCLDAFRGARHIEYWSTADNNISYVINATAAPNISNGSDITAIQSAFAVWPAIANTELVATYGGTVAQANADGLDHINLVTFIDNTFSYSNLVLAVGLTTSFESDTTIAARVYKKGEIFDADMLFNPSKTFKVGGVGPGVDIQSVATHEAGHMFGLSHSTIQSSTMFYALPGGLAARSLTTDDQLVYFKAYGSATALSSAKNIHGVVHNGNTNLPVPGAIVFLVDAATNDTTACDYTLPDGSYAFPGLANGNYYVAIHALDGTSSIGFIQPGNINSLVATTADINFKPEWYDNAESESDDPDARTQVSISNGQPVATADLITNVDVAAPEVLLARPDGTNAIAVDGAIVIEFSEAIDINTITSSFSLRDQATNAAKGGNIALIRDDTQIVFTPSPPLEFSTGYRLRFDTDLKDHAGNALAADYTADFTTEAEPPVSIASLAPNKGVKGTTLVISGHGFDVSPLPSVTFNGVPATVQSGTVGRLVVDVPDNATTGPVVVTNSDAQQSNTLTFTVLTDAEFARGYESGQTILPAAPNAIAITPGGDYAYIAGVGGAHAVVVNPALQGYLSATNIPYPSELVDIATTANGKRVYAISTGSGEMVEINSDPTTGLLFNTILASRDLGGEPRGLITDPTGERAYIAMDDGHIQSWDIELGSANYNEQVGLMTAPAADGFGGPLAINPAGNRLMAVTNGGRLAFYDLPAETLLTDINVGLSPRGIAVEPTGQRAYVTHDNGDVTVINIEGAPFKVQDIATGGSVRNAIVTPAASYIYTTDRELDNLKIVDLRESSATFRSVVGVIPAQSNPVDVVMSPGGEYAFSVLQGGGAVNTSPRMLVTTIGIGPTLEAVAPLHAPVGAQVVLSGRDFGDGINDVPSVSFNGVIATLVTRNVDRVVVTVPAGATSGPVRVRTTSTGTGAVQESNALFFDVFTFNSFPNLRESVLITPPGGDDINHAVAMRPQGDVLFCGTNQGRILAFDTRPGSPTFHQSIGRFLATSNATADMAVSADGRALFVVGGNPASPEVLVLTADPNAPNFGETVQGFVMPGSTTPQLILVETSPDNKHVAVLDQATHQLAVFDATGAADGLLPQLVTTNNSFAVTEMHFSPSGLALYLGNQTTGSVSIMNTNLESGFFGLVFNSLPIPGAAPVQTPMSLATSPDGTKLYALTQQLSGPVARSLFTWTVNPLDGDTGLPPTQNLAVAGGSLRREHFVVSPRGDTAVRTQYGDNLHYMNVGTMTDVVTSGSALALTDVGVAFDPTGNRLYYTDTINNGLRVFELANPRVIFEISGDTQNGVTGEFLPAPLRCRIFDELEFGFPVPGVSVTVRVTQGGGLLKSGEDLVSEMVVASDKDGYVEALWQMGTPATNQQVEFICQGLVASPVVFTASSAADPESLPLTVNEILPAILANNVSTSTAVVVTFSRAVDPATVNLGSLWVQVTADATKVPVTYGFTDSNRRVSMTPSQQLAYTTPFSIIVNTGVHAPNGEPVSFTTSSFTTGAPPALALAAISPPSALVGVNVMLSGQGFNVNPASNTVNFTGGATAIPISGNSTELVVKVPAGAIPGPVTVTRNAATSNGVNFTVLVPSLLPIDEVISSINTGSGAKTCTVSPDGSLCYTVSPDGDVVIPVDIAGETTYPAISVGDQPVAIVMRPDGKVAYVANFNSGSVSVIDVDKNSATFNTVTATITVGTNPADLAVFPDGDRVLVANAGSGDVSVIDSDGTSASYHEVISTIGQATGAKTVTVSPDGTRVYIGTNINVIVMSANSYTVISSINTGTGAKSLTVTPDGTLLFVLTTAGTILVVDVQPGSTSENQVISTIGTGTGAKGLTVSPDGTLLFVILEGSDNVLVISINVIPGVGVASGAAPSFTFQSTVIDEIPLASSPAFVAVDPSGTGKLFVTTPGDKALVVINASDVAIGPVPARVSITPSTLNLNSNGKYVTGTIELALPFFTAEIVPTSIRLQGTIPAVPGTASLGDANADGIQELTVKFDRATFQAVLPQGEYVPVTVTGDVRNRTFAGEDTIRTLRPNVVTPHGGQHVVSGAPTQIEWTTPNGYGNQVSSVDIHFSGDNGTTWTQIANKIANSGTFTWTTPANAYLPQCRLMITLNGTHNDVFAQGMNQDPFLIAAPVAVALKSAGAKVVDGDAVLSWETNFEENVSGFHVVRSEEEEGLYTTITRDMIASKGNAAGSSYEYHDTSIRPNRTYWYKLVEVTPDGDASQFGPYSVSFKVTNTLEQNVPNPFNPATTIKYSIAQDTDVSLVVYDVSGRRVRTLVDSHQRADVYKMAWDGLNDQGARVASGVYFYKLVAGKYVQTRKMMLLK